MTRGVTKRNSARMQLLARLLVTAAVVLLASPAPPVQAGGSPLLAYASRADGRTWEIYVLYSDGSKKRLTPHGQYNYTRTQPTWSPDGKSIAYQEWTYCDWPCYPYVNIDVYRTGAESYSPVNLTNTDGWTWEGQPAWSPDGSKIAFSLSNDSNWTLWLMNADGTGKTQLTFPVAEPGTSTYDYAPAWSPDGSGSPSAARCTASPVPTST